MKKLLVLLLVAALAVTAVACSSTKSSASSAPVSSASESASASMPDSAPEEMAPDESAPEMSAPTFAIPEANQKLGDIITAARTQEFNDAFQLVLSPEDPIAPMLFELMGLKTEDLSSFALSVSPMNTKAYGVAILKPAEGKGEAVLAAVNGWVTNQQKSFETYLADQYEIAKAATVDTLADGTIVLVMSDGGAAVQKTILDALK